MSLAASTEPDPQSGALGATRAPERSGSWVWQALATCCEAPLLFGFWFVAAAFREPFEYLGDELPFASRTIIASEWGALGASAIGAALAATQIGLLIALAATRENLWRTAFRRLALFNLCPIALMLFAMYAPLLRMWGLV